MTDIEQLLADEAERLLAHRCTTIPKESLHLPGPDYVDRLREAGFGCGGSVGGPTALKLWRKSGFVSASITKPRSAKQVSGAGRLARTLMRRDLGKPTVLASVQTLKQLSRCHLR